MDFADDVAYSVHDLEDGVVGGRIDLGLLDRAEERDATWATVRDWYLPDASDDAARRGARPAPGGRRPGPVRRTTGAGGPRRAEEPHQRPDRDLLRQRPPGHPARRTASGRWCATEADLVVPDETVQEIAVLKGIAAHYVMRAQDRVDLMERQRTLLRELFEAIWQRGSEALDPALRHDFARAPRRRRPHPRGDRPDRQPHRRLRGHPARPPGARQRATRRERLVP